MDYLNTLGERAKKAARSLNSCNITLRNEALEAISKKLSLNHDKIIEVNKIDIENARKNGKEEYFIDRLTLTKERIEGICLGLKGIISLPDPLSEIDGGSVLKNGLILTKRRVPLGVIGIIYESRPNVTVDAAALCLKSGNVCVLRGGSDAINSSKCLVSLMREALRETGLSENVINLVEDTSRETATQFMKLNKYIDVLIPRGGGGLINSVVMNATVPVIKTGEGVCHVYVDEFADTDMAVNIADNAKTQRPSVCNSIETILVHEKIAKEFLLKLKRHWGESVEIYGDDKAAEIIEITRPVTDADYGVEFLSNKVAIRVVKDIDEAIEHIDTYGTKHSESIITKDYYNANYFKNAVDACAVYVNASTRFTDGFEFGMGAEIGISNQKLHARGPLGLRELTTIKYTIDGNGQIRN